ncbi:MAG: low molecular weight phosphotyrosine protein phosphatase [Thermoleophilia bacterium]|nr:low molecular weight phosphotyrosine protein phosphatase [Thermoleophilia bacterium]
MAAAVMAHRAAEAGVPVQVDSAGTAGWHIGEPADPRTAAELRRRGVALTHAARQFAAADFARFDLVLAMDADNARNLRRLAPSAHDAAKVRLLREFDAASHDGDRDVPDPYYGGDDGFRRVFEMVDAACLGLLETLRTR